MSSQSSHSENKKYPRRSVFNYRKKNGRRVRSRGRVCHSPDDFSQKASSTCLNSFDRSQKASKFNCVDNRDSVPELHGSEHNNKNVNVTEVCEPTIRRRIAANSQMNRMAVTWQWCREMSSRLNRTQSKIGRVCERMSEGMVVLQLLL